MNPNNDATVHAAAHAHTHRPRAVLGTVALVYTLLLLLCAKGLYHWSCRLPASSASATLRTVTEGHWRSVAELGLEEPELSLERFFLSLQDAHRLLYPHSYGEEMARREAKAHLKIASAAAKAAAAKKAATTVIGMEPLPASFKDPRRRGPRVLVLGDSIMLTLGPVVKSDIEHKLGGVAVVKAKLATGLARPDVFDWLGEVKRTTAAAHFDYAVVMLGTNDSQDFEEGGQIFTYGTPDWVRIYNKRLAALMAAACEGATHGLWIGLPPMRSEAFDRKVLRINSWAALQARSHTCMQFVATGRLVGDEEGKFAPYLPIKRHLEKVRTTDGIHLTSKGGSLISASLVDLLRQKIPYVTAH